MHLSSLKITFRNILRQKIYSFINLVGLSIGIACFLLILLFIADEISFDRYHANADRIHRVTYETGLDSAPTAQTPAPLAPALLQEYSEVKKAVRFWNPGPNILAKSGEKSFYESRTFFADESVFDIFSFSFVKGDPATALREPNSVVLTERTAQRYFGGQDPMGKVIGLENFQEFMVTGVMKDIPRNSHFQIDLLASITTLSRHSRMLEHWGNIMYHTYVLLEEGASPDGLERKFPEFVKKYIGGAFRSLFEGNPGMLSRYRFHLQPLANIHLRSHLDGEIEPNGDIKYIYIFSAVALFILLIACINFTNITTARSSTRLREVGIRKIVGGWRASLFGHFLGEAFWLVMIALLLGIILVELFLPVFNSFLARELSFSSIPPWKLAGVLLAILALAGLFSGIYPALLLSSIRPVDALKGRMIRGKLSAQGFRTVMVVFQFSISIILIASTLIMFRQMEYIREKKLGFNKDYLLAIDGGRFARLRNRYDAVRAELLNTPGIVAVAASSALPAGPLARTTVRPEGSEFSESVLMANMAVSHEFLDTYGAALAEGRNFSKDLSTDLADAMVINEAAARQFGWKNAVGRKLEIVGNWKGTVIGVARDFHFDSLHAKIEPLILYVRPFFYRYLTVRMHSRDISGTIARIEKIWKNFDNTRPFDFSFLDDKIDQLYRGDRKLSLIFLYFTVLSIGIACLGLFGLVSFAAERRMKEMGIRKVLGASARDIIAHISGQFLKWVLAANILAWPLTYYFMSLWLQNFAYRVGISAAVLLAAAGITLALSIGTVSWQAIRAARSNPADVLRFE